jgi:hypothetical protein
MMRHAAGSTLRTRDTGSSMSSITIPTGTPRLGALDNRFVYGATAHGVIPMATPRSSAHRASATGLPRTRSRRLQDHDDRNRAAAARGRLIAMATRSRPGRKTRQPSPAIAFPESDRPVCVPGTTASDGEAIVRSRRPARSLYRIARQHPRHRSWATSRSSADSRRRAAVRATPTSPAWAAPWFCSPARPPRNSVRSWIGVALKALVVDCP